MTSTRLNKLAQIPLFKSDTSGFEALSGGGGGVPSSNSQNVPMHVQNMLKQVEAKQDVLQLVLSQVLENLAHLRQTVTDFTDIRQKRSTFEDKIDRLLVNQEILIKK